jgi:hypothetical protein
MGMRFGVEKGEDKDFDKWHKGKINYCKKDVEITEILYNFLAHKKLPR